MIQSSSPCPCCSGQKYSECCQPFHDNKSNAPTAEKLMRSRYSAYVVGNIDYIEKTHIAGTGKDDFDRDAATKWSQTAKWLGLEVKSTKAGKESDQTGEVEFIAKYEIEGKAQEHYEIGLFEKKDSVWFYKEAKNLGQAGPIRREQPKVGRNDPCPCGSGKKYKKCCEAAAV